MRDDFFLKIIFRLFSHSSSFPNCENKLFFFSFFKCARGKFSFLTFMSFNFHFVCFAERLFHKEYFLKEKTRVNCVSFCWTRSERKINSFMMETLTWFIRTIQTLFLVFHGKKFSLFLLLFIQMKDDHQKEVKVSFTIWNMFFVSCQFIFLLIPNQNAINRNFKGFQQYAVSVIYEKVIEEEENNCFHCEILK